MISSPKPSDPDVAALIHLAIGEDGKDLTTQALSVDNLQIEASIVSKEQGVLCGLSIAEGVFRAVDADTLFLPQKKDGERVFPGDIVATLKGRAAAILQAERPALNFLQQLSGVATLTAKFVAAVKDYRVRILDTRKTIPGWRRLQKYAVRMGGGENHRMNLAGMALIKENHIRVAGTIEAAVDCLRQQQPTLRLEVEATNLGEVKTLLDMQVPTIMLDNFTAAEVAAAVDLSAGRAVLEASGGIDLDNIIDYAKSGVDCISIGRLTHSAAALDCSLQVLADNTP